MLTCKYYLEFLPKFVETFSKNYWEVNNCPSLYILSLLLLLFNKLSLCLFFFQLIPKENYFSKFRYFAFQMFFSKIYVDVQIKTHILICYCLTT